LWVPIIGVRAGFIRANGRTFGSASSGATERANADCLPLYSYLWSNFSDAECAVSGGRGGTSLADFNANKPMATYTMRGRAAYGLDDMGGAAAGVITGATTITAVGAQSQTVAQANLPNVTWTSTLAAPAHTHTTGSLTLNSTAITFDTPSGTTSCVSTGGSGTSGWGTGLNGGSVALAAHLTSGALTGTSSGASATALTGSVVSGGSGTALATLSPGRPGTWYIKL
jgi:hypothetical protein